MVNRAIAYATAIVILALGYYQYLSTTRLSDVQKRYRRVADQAEIIKAQEQKIDSEQSRSQACSTSFRPKMTGCKCE
jgi:hypothetical protein